MLSPQLIATLDKLPPNLQAEVLNYAEYLAAKSTQPQSSDPAPIKYRQAGTMKGMFAMADDFDAPLEDLKDYM
jgi:Protein of unknown function (DUF2281)